MHIATNNTHTHSMKTLNGQGTDPEPLILMFILTIILQYGSPKV